MIILVGRIIQLKKLSVKKAPKLPFLDQLSCDGHALLLAIKTFWVKFKNLLKYPNVMKI